MAWRWSRALRRRSQSFALVVLAWGAVAPGCGDEDVPAAELGARLFSATELSTSPINRFSCATCHVVAPGAPAIVPNRWDSGYNLAGAAARRSWWGGGALRLLDAINVCVGQFMGGRALVAEEPRARQLGEFLAVNAPAQTLDPVPLTIVRATTPLTELTGNRERGALIYTSSCLRCHGALHTGSGRLDSRTSILPEETLRAFPNAARAAFVEKIRHGRFFNIGGVMPFYSVEAMSDADVADLLAYAGL